MQPIQTSIKIFLILCFLVLPLSFVCAEELPIPIGTLLYQSSKEGLMYGYNTNRLLSVFDKDWLNSGHVGIYIGNGEILEATLEGVIIHSAKEFIDTKDTDKKFIGAKIPKEYLEKYSIDKETWEKKFQEIVDIFRNYHYKYDLNFSKQKGPGNREWTCVGLTEKIFESLSKKKKANKQILIYNTSEYGFDIVPDGFDQPENYKNSSCFTIAKENLFTPQDWDDHSLGCFSKTKEFSYVQELSSSLHPILGNILGVKDENNKGPYIFFPATQFYSDKLQDVEVDINWFRSDIKVSFFNKTKKLIFNTIIKIGISEVKTFNFVAKGGEKITVAIARTATGISVKTKEAMQGIGSFIYGLFSSPPKETGEIIFKQSSQSTAEDKIKDKEETKKGVLGATTIEERKETKKVKEKKETKDTKEINETKKTNETIKTKSASSTKEKQNKSKDNSTSIEIKKSGSGQGMPNVSYPKLLISEVYIEGKNDFIEIFNPNPFAVDINNWYLQKKTKNSSSFSSFISKTYFIGKTINGYSHFLISRPSSTYAYLADIVADKAMGEETVLVLKNPKQEIVDNVSWYKFPSNETTSYGRIFDTVKGEYSDIFDFLEPTPREINKIKIITTTTLNVVNSAAEATTTSTTTNQNFFAQFSFSPLEPEINQEILFNASPSTSSDSQIISYFWDFGDGNFFFSTSTATTSHSFSTTTPTSSLVTLIITDNNNATTATSSLIVFKEVPNLKVVINEIGWMGTKASSTDEWIELYNNTDESIDLTGWTLKSRDGSPSTTLTGSIDEQWFYLLERTNNNTNTIQGVSADWKGSFSYGLKNSGEDLELRDANGVLIDIINCSSTGWFAGTTTPAYISMERVSSTLSGNDKTNWASNNLITRNGKDANREDIYGTPKSKNSVSISPTYITEDNWPLSSSSSLSQFILSAYGSPYIIKKNNAIEIPASTTLIIDPNVEIEFDNGASFEIYGNLVAKGTQNKKIIFTSTSTDSSYSSCSGGDSCAIFGPFNVWGGNIELENVKIENLNFNIEDIHDANIKMNNVEFFGNNEIWYGAYDPRSSEKIYYDFNISKSNFEINNSSFKNNNLQFLKIDNSIFTFNTSTFENNIISVSSTNVTYTIKNSVFFDNQIEEIK